MYKHKTDSRSGVLSHSGTLSSRSTSCEDSHVGEVQRSQRGKCKTVHVEFVSQKCQETMQRSAMKCLSLCECSKIQHSYFVTNKHFLPLLCIVQNPPPGQARSGESLLCLILGKGEFWKQEGIYSDNVGNSLIPQEPSEMRLCSTPPPHPLPPTPVRGQSVLRTFLSSAGHMTALTTVIQQERHHTAMHRALNRPGSFYFLLLKCQPPSRKRPLCLKNMN